MKSPDLIRTIEIKDRTGRVIGKKDVVTYPGLLSKAHEEGLSKVETSLLQIPTDENARTAIAKAVVETSKGRFEGIGDATPENVNSFIVPHLIRMAETRAKARALRDAVNIGIVSFEELDGDGLLSNGSDLGSGAPPAQERGSGNDRQRPVSPNEAAVGSDPLPMTEAQRRYLFRILAGRGISGDTAHAFLKDFLGVPTLKEVSKEDASAVIDQLLKDPELGKGGHGTPLD